MGSLLSVAVITTRQDNPHKEELQNNISPISEEDATISQVQNNISPISEEDATISKVQNEAEYTVEPRSSM